MPADHLPEEWRPLRSAMAELDEATSQLTSAVNSVYLAISDLRLKRIVPPDIFDPWED